MSRLAERILEKGIEKNEEKPKLCGLYRRYDGKYVYVLGGILNVEDRGVLVRYVFVGDDTEYCMPYELFFGSEYLHHVIDSGCVADGNPVYVPIEQHPDNVTGQTVCHIKIVDLDNFGKNLNTDELIEILRKRNDNPLQDLDIEGFNDNVWCREYLVGVSKEEGVFLGRKTFRGVVPYAIFNSKEEAGQYLVEHELLMKQDRLDMYKVVYIKL